MVLYNVYTVYGDITIPEQKDPYCVSETSEFVQSKRLFSESQYL